MMSEFNAVEEDHTPSTMDVNLTDKQKMLIESIRNQHLVFQHIIMSQINLNSMMSKTTDHIVLNNCATLHYQFLNTQTNNAHEQTMKRMQLEFDLKKMEIGKEVKIKELEIRSKELDNENYKLKNYKK